MAICPNEVHIGDIGTVFRVTLNDCGGGTPVVVDVSSATTKQILFTKPDKTVLTKDATFTTDGTDGQIEYASIDGDLDAKGTWKIQARIVFPNGSKWSSDVSKFKVYPNLD